MNPTTMIDEIVYNEFFEGRRVVVVKRQARTLTWYCGYVSDQYPDPKLAYQEYDLLCGQEITFYGSGRTIIPGYTRDVKFYGFDTAGQPEGLLKYKANGFAKSPLERFLNRDSVDMECAITQARAWAEYLNDAQGIEDPIDIIQA